MTGRRTPPWPTAVLPLVAVVLASAWRPSAAAPHDRDNVFRLLVLHTNDMHARFEQTDWVGNECTATAAGHCFGGFPRLKTAVRQARAQAAGTVDGTLFLNAGDTFQGTALFSFFGWSLAARMVQLLDIDVMSFGNHEFDNGVKDAQSFVHNITVPVVCSNLDLTGEPSLANEPNLMKSKVVTVNGRKIGIIGYLLPETMNLADTGDVKITPEIPSITDEAKRLKNQGVNILIALGHSGFEMDTKIAEQVSDIDLVIGGHSNTFLYSGKEPDTEIPDGSYPFWVEQPNTKRKVPVVQAFHISKYLGELWLEFDGNGEVIKSYGNPILLDSHIEQDAETLEIVEYFKKQIEIKTSRVIGSTSVFLEGDNEHCRINECNMGNFITDSFIDFNVRQNIKSFNLKERWTDAPIAMIQSGGIRTSINQLTMKGNITYNDLLTAMPFNNRVGIVTIKGSEIWKAFEHSVHRYNPSIGNGEFLQVSGLKATIDLGQPMGKRVQSVYARCGNCVVPVYKELDLNGNYSVIMSDYLADGGDGHNIQKLEEFRDIGVTDLEVMEKEIHIMSPIRPEVGGRIVLLNMDKLRVTKNNPPPRTTSGQRVSSAPNMILLLTVTVACLDVHLNIPFTGSR